MMSSDPNPSGVAKVAALAQGLLMRRASRMAPGFSLGERLDAASIADAADFDGLIDGGRDAARDRLGIGTLDETDRVLSALGRARKELSQASTTET